MIKLNLELTKRHKIIITSLILPLALLVVWFAPLTFFLVHIVQIVLGLMALAFILTLWSLWEGIDKLKGFILLILPTLFTLGMVSYFFVLDKRFLAIPLACIFGGVFYVLLLSQNIFNVASVRTIPLYRAASTTVLVLTLITAFCLYNVVFAFNLLFPWAALAVFVINFLLILPFLWTIEMTGINSLILTYTFVLSLITAEIGMSLAFWPISHPMSATILITSLFITLGISTHSLRERMSRGMVLEYLAWGVLVFALAFATTSWTG